MIGYNRKKFYTLLLDRKLINQEDLDKAIEEQENCGDPLEKVLVDLGLLSEENACKILSDYLNLPFLPASEYPETPLLGIDFRSKFLKQNKFFPLEIKDNTLSIAMVNPLDFTTIDEIVLFTNRKVKVYISKMADILAAIDKHYGGGSSKVSNRILQLFI